MLKLVDKLFWRSIMKLGETDFIEAGSGLEGA